MLPERFRPLALHVVGGMTIRSDPCWHVVAFNYAILARVILHGAKLAGINVEKATVSAHWGGCHQRGDGMMKLQHRKCVTGLKVAH